MSKVVDINKQRKKRRRKKQGLGVALLSLFVVFLVFFFFLKVLTIDEVMVTGTSHYTEEEIKEMTGIKEGVNLLQVYMGQRKTYSKYLYLKHLNIAYHDFSKVTISVEEKTIAGYIPFMESYICIDKEGFVLDYISEPTKGYPVIEGVTVDAFVLGEKIQLSETLLQSFLMLYRSKEQYGLKIDKIIFEDNKLSKITLYIGRLKINFGGIEGFNEKLIKLKDYLPKVDMDVDSTLDLETGTIK